MWVTWSTRRTPPAAHAASTTCDGLVIEPVCETALRTAASERPGESSTTGLPACDEGAGCGHEGTSVDHVLGIDRDGARPLVVDARPHQVDHGEVGLVAQRHEAGDPEATLGEQRRQVEDHVAALAEHRDLPGREHRVAQLQSGAGVGDTETVRPDQHRTPGAGDRDRLGLGPGALVAELGEARGDGHDRASSGGDRLAHGGHERRRRDAQHHEVHRLAEPVAGVRQRGVRGLAQYVGAAPVHQGDGTARAGRERPFAEDVSPLGGVAAGTHDRDRAGLEEGGQSGVGRALW